VQAGTAVVIACSYLAKLSTANWEEVPAGIPQKDVKELVDYLKMDDSRGGEVVVFRRARFLALFSGLKALDILQVSDPTSALEHYRTNGVSRVVLLRAPVFSDQVALASLVQVRSNSFALSFQNQGFEVYTVRYGRE
jgi:hypothetical protein